MSQHDMNLANANGATFRADLNDALGALVTNSSGASAPATTFAYQWWADTTTGILKQRNAANSAWISILTLSTGTPAGHVIGTDIQAYDAALASLAALSLAQGDLIYATAADTYARLAKGTAAQLLRMNAGATAPEWFTPSASGITHNAVVNANSATAHSLGSSLPSGVVSFSVAFSGLSTNGTSVPVIQMGDSGGLETSGYSSYCSRNSGGGVASDASITAGVPLLITAAAAASNTIDGLIRFMLIDAATNTWAFEGNTTAASGVHTICGTKSLSATLDRVSLTTVNGTDTYDGSGKAAMQYE